MNPTRRICLAALPLLLLGGCSGLTKRPQPPRVSLAGIELLSLGLFEQRFRIHLNLDNPNDYALPVSGLDYALELNGRAFADGRSLDEVELPANGRAQMALEMGADLGALIGRALLLQQGRLPALNYRLTGKLRLMEGLVSVPFERRGSVPLTRTPEAGGD